MWEVCMYIFVEYLSYLFDFRAIFVILWTETHHQFSD